MKHHLLLILIVFLTVANVLVWTFLGLEKAYAYRVYPGIWVQAQPLAGLTKEQAIDRLKPVNEMMLQEKVTLTLGDKEYQPTLLDLGYKVDTEAMADTALNLGRGKDLKKILATALDYRKKGSIPLVYDIDQGKFDDYLNEIGKSIIKEPKNLALDYVNGEIVTTPAEQGVVLNKEELRQAIQKEARPGKTARIVLTYHQSDPEIKEEPQLSTAKNYLEKLLIKPLIIQAEDVSLELKPEKIYSFVYYEIQDNRLTADIDENQVRSALAELAKKVDIKPVAKRISAVNNQVIDEGSDGRQLNAPDATKRVMERLKNTDLETPVVLLVTKVDRKTVTESPEFQPGRYAGRYIEIDLSAQRLHLLEGDNYHTTYLISTGKWSTPTPVGDFEIMNHINVAWSKPFRLYMPLWMGLKKQAGPYEGYGIHGLPYWPGGRKEGVNHLGRPVSHGCIRLDPGDAEYVYAWAENGTKVVIHQ